MTKVLAILLTALLFVMPSFAVGAEGGGYNHEVLQNGLEVFVVENDAVPLVTIMISFRCGAIAQAPETAGLFHLYEHMLFAGNEVYPTQAAFTAALNKMGVANWNGGTSNEYVNYYITIPSEKLAEGIGFWAHAVKDSLFDPETFEGEKGVVINEIRGYHNDPDDIFSNAINSRIFGDFPWRKDISGSERNISSATVEQMKKIKETFYIPKNAAVLVGGAAKKSEVLALVAKNFGDWKGDDAFAVAEKPHSGISADKRLLYVDENFYSGIAQVDMVFRGPDVLRQTKDTYTADVILFLLSSPVGKFKKALMDKIPGQLDAKYISLNYPTQRDGGLVSFSSYLNAEGNDPEGPFIDRVEAMKIKVMEEFALLAKTPGEYFSLGQLELAKTKLIDSNILSSETASGFLGTVNFWWSTASADYFFSYEDNCRKVSFADISSFLNTYIVNQSSALAVRVNAELAAADPSLGALADKIGYERIDSENAYWWQK